MENSTVTLGKRRLPIKSKRNRTMRDKLFTLADLNIIHDAVIDGRYEDAQLKLFTDKIIPKELEGYARKLQYDVKRSLCDWDSNFDVDTMEIMKRTMDEIVAGQEPLSVDPFFALCLPFNQSQLGTLNRAHVLCQFEPPRFGNRRNVARQKGGNIRIGYMSSDFHHHSLSHLVSSIPRYHSPNKFDVYCIHLRHTDDFIPEDYFYRERVNTGATQVIDLSKVLDDNEAAKLLASFDIDILVDYNGSTGSFRHGILAKKPAKIQVMNLIGFCGTSGNPAIDYVILDKTVAPLNTVQRCFTEKGAFMPFCYMIADYVSLFPHLQYKNVLMTEKHGNIVVNSFKPLPLWVKESPCIRRIEEMLDNEDQMLTLNGHSIYHGKLPENWRSQPHRQWSMMVVTCRKEFGLPTDAVVFSNFNHPWKSDPKTFKGWMQILRKVKGSVLWQMGENKTVEKNLKRYARCNGVDPSRLIFYPQEDKLVHLRRIQLSDVTLDTAVFNGHTTSMDALWAGVPIVTMTGDTVHSRVATSILKAMDLSDLIAETQEKYIEIAVELGNNSHKRDSLQKIINEKKLSSSLFNVADYVRNLEKLYCKMMKHYNEGKDPDHIFLSEMD